jgi:DNA-binding Lrp family transcriptional regulator
MNKQLLDILRTEARAPLSEIAARLDQSEADVARDLAELERKKIVLGYRAVINPDKLDDEICIGIIEVNITPQRGVGYDEIAAQIYKFPEVKLCYLLSGAYDLLVFVEGAHLKEVATFVAQKLATISNVNNTRTHFILKKYKEAGIIIGEEDTPQRLPITP